MDNLFIKLKRGRNQISQLQSTAQLTKQYPVEVKEAGSSRILSAQNRLEKLPELLAPRYRKLANKPDTTSRLFRSFDDSKENRSTNQSPNQIREIDVQEKNSYVPIQENQEHSNERTNTIFASYARSIGIRSAERRRPPNYFPLLDPSHSRHNRNRSHEARIVTNNTDNAQNRFGEAFSRLEQLDAKNDSRDKEFVNSNQNMSSNIHWKYGNIPLVRKVMENIRHTKEAELSSQDVRQDIHGVSRGGENPLEGNFFTRKPSMLDLRLNVRLLPTDFETLSLKHRIHLARMSKSFILTENPDNQTLYSFAKVMYNGVRYAYDSDSDPVVDFPQPSTTNILGLFRSGPGRKLLLIEPLYILAIGVSNPSDGTTTFILRPHARTFIETLAKDYIVLFYSSRDSKHAQAIREAIDPGMNLVKDILDYRHCSKTRDGRLVKDLGCLGFKQRKDMLLVDYKMHGLKLQPENAVILTHWNKDPTDQYLLGPVLGFLQSLAHVFDVREALRQNLDYRRYLIPP